MTVFVANLDCEVEWAGAPPLPAPVRAMLGGLGTLARVLPFDAIAVLAAVARTRLPATGHGPRASEPEIWVLPVAASPLPVASLWGQPDAGPANDRRVAVQVARGLGDTDARVVASMAEALEEAIAALPHWVAKAVICAAGRDRVRRRGRELDPSTRTRLARLLERGGALIVEPWRARTLDLGQPGEVSDDGVVLAPPHLLICDEGGGFRGIAIGDPRAAAYAGELEVAGRAAGAALARLGYRGKFVVDAFVHEGGLRPVVEINARWTFGWLARAWAERLGPGTLELGRGAPPAGATALLLPGDGDPTSAWFTSARSRSPAP